MVGTALDNDVARVEQRLRILHNEENFSLHYDAVVDGARAVHGRAMARTHLDHADDRTAGRWRELEWTIIRLVLLNRRDARW